MESLFATDALSDEYDINECINEVCKWVSVCVCCVCISSFCWTCPCLLSYAIIGSCSFCRCCCCCCYFRFSFVWLLFIAKRAQNNRIITGGTLSWATVRNTAAAATVTQQQGTNNCLLDFLFFHLYDAVGMHSTHTHSTHHITFKYTVMLVGIAANL